MFVKNKISNLYFLFKKKNLISFFFFSKKDIINYIYKIYKINVFEVNTHILYKKRFFKKNSKTNFKVKYNRFKKVFLRLYKNQYVICQ